MLDEAITASFMLEAHEQHLLSAKAMIQELQSQIPHIKQEIRKAKAKLKTFPKATIALKLSPE